jgi:hypothetical protein
MSNASIGPIQAAIVQWVNSWIRALPRLVEVTFRKYNVKQQIDLGKAKEAMAFLRSKVVALENQEREAGRSWEAPTFKVILQERSGLPSTKYKVVSL